MGHPSPHIPWWVKAGAGWALTHPAEALVLGYAMRYAPVPTARVIWAFGAEYGPATARLGGRVGTIAFESSAIVRGGVAVARFAGTYAAAVAVGYIAGAAVGTAVSGLIWGDKGARDAIDLYTGQVGVHDYFATVGGALGFD